MAVQPTPTVLVEHPGTYPEPNRAPEQPKTLKVWSPEGVAEEHSILNARDLVRSRGYTYSDPKSPKPDPKRIGVGGMVGGVSSYESRDPVLDLVKPEVNPAMDELNALRAKAADVLGGADKVDQRWGKNRLEQEIAAASKTVVATPPVIKASEVKPPEVKVTDLKPASVSAEKK